MRRAALLAGAVALAGAAGCSGDSEEAVTTVVATPSAAQSGPRTGPIQRRLTRDGYHVIANPVPDGRLSLTTGIRQMIVYIEGFRNGAGAAAYARTVSATARDAPGQVVARRVGRRVYTAVAAEAPGARASPDPLLELIRTAEGRRAKPVRLSPR